MKDECLNEFIKDTNMKITDMLLWPHIYDKIDEDEYRKSVNLEKSDKDKHYEYNLEDITIHPYNEEVTLTDYCNALQYNKQIMDINIALKILFAICNVLNILEMGNDKYIAFARNLTPKDITLNVNNDEVEIHISTLSYLSYFSHNKPINPDSIFWLAQYGYPDDRRYKKCNKKIINCGLFKQQLNYLYKHDFISFKYIAEYIINCLDKQDELVKKLSNVIFDIKRPKEKSGNWKEMEIRLKKIL